MDLVNDAVDLEPELELVVEAPAGWVVLDRDDAVDADEHALAVHRSLAEDLVHAGGRVDPAAVDAAARTLAAVTRTARDLLRGRGGLAFAHVGHPEVPTALWLDVLARPEHDFAAWADHRFDVEIPAADPRCEVHAVDLPAGPARRVRSTTVPDDVGAPVAEGVDVLVRPDRAPGRVVLSSRWTALAHGDLLAGLVDAFARTVRVRSVPAGGTRP
ncbi:hypothetical protein [Kineococcus radiotolerans]|uniref:hypothetical protein n=1 Tax=Kineococcus radiotolerans TaxID=131568 RepID=UPI00003A4DAC|nr:hypothetical protein [Kineococcus radiotolerans]